MNLKKLSILLIGIAFFWACETAKNNNASNENTAKKAETSELSRVDTPDSIKEKIKSRGEQDQALPELIVESPKEGETVNSSTVKVKVKVVGDLKGLKIGKDESGTGNHVHVILDNQPYAAHYMWNEGFELRNVTDGEHTLRIFRRRNSASIA